MIHFLIIIVFRLGNHLRFWIRGRELPSNVGLNDLVAALWHTPAETDSTTISLSSPS